jgi:regulator of sigma D
VNFGEKYGDHTEESLSEDFDRDLASVGQLLEERFEYEDALIEALFNEDEKAA